MGENPMHEENKIPWNLAPGQGPLGDPAPGMRHLGDPAPGMRPLGDQALGMRSPLEETKNPWKEEKFNEETKNPWDVEHLEEFLYFCCPECDLSRETIYQSKDLFIQHALNHHPKGIYIEFTLNLIRNIP